MDQKRSGKVCWGFSQPVYGFAFRLDRLAFKKLSKNKVYEHIKKSFDEEIAKKIIHRNQRKEQLPRQKKGQGL